MWWAHWLSHHFPVMVPSSPDTTVPGADRRGRQAAQVTCPSRVAEPFRRPVPGQAARNRDEASNSVGFEADVGGRGAVVGGVVLRKQQVPCLI